MLDELVEHICRVNETVLAGEHASLADLIAAGAPGPRPEPWRVVVLLADAATADELTNSQRAQLDRICRTGVACGVHLIVRGLRAGRPPDRACGIAAASRPRPATSPATCRSGSTRRRPPSGSRRSAGPPPSGCAPDRHPPRSPTWNRSGCGPSRPRTAWSRRSATAPTARLVEVALGDDPPHALIGGPSGSGKTNLIYAWLAALATRYGPEELALYLLDFKEGVSFARFVPGRARPELAAAGAAGRHQRERRPRVRPGHAAPPRRGAAHPGPGRQAVRRHQARPSCAPRTRTGTGRGSSR